MYGSARLREVSTGDEQGRESLGRSPAWSAMITLVTRSINDGSLPPGGDGSIVMVGLLDVATSLRRPLIGWNMARQHAARTSDRTDSGHAETKGRKSGSKRPQRRLRDGPSHSELLLTIPPTSAPRTLACHIGGAPPVGSEPVKPGRVFGSTAVLDGHSAGDLPVFHLVQDRVDFVESPGCDFRADLSPRVEVDGLQ